ncbi:MAG: S8 family serine peptidase [Anaerolineae bacterium]
MVATVVPKVDRRLFVIFLVLCLISTTALLPALPQAEGGNVQPILRQMAASQPETVVGLIVQKAGSGQSPEELVRLLGGRVTKDLRIINAFAAELPASEVERLARDPGVRWVSFDAPMIRQGGPDEPIETGNLLNAYILAIGADDVWAEGYQGSGVTVAVVDSGIRSNFQGKKLSDLKDSDSDRSRVLHSESFSTDSRNVHDEFGHGTHVAGIIGGNGALSDDTYIGVAPSVNLLNVKVSDAYGAGYESDVVAGLQWIYEHEDEYEIRVINISLNSSVPQSYHTSPLDAAVEILWFNGIVVVVSAGNNAVDHNGILYPPANDPFVITVGAVDDRGTFDTGDDVLAPFSAQGKTADGFFKPDLVVPGTNIISLSAGRGARLAREHWDHQVGKYYFRMSGTSMASAVTSGAVALLLQAQPDLNPDQVKWRLMHTTEPFPVEGAGAGYLNVYNAVHNGSRATANTGQVPSELLWTGSDPPAWDSVHWDSVHWDSVHWDSMHWDSVHWDSVHWDSVHWGDAVYSSSISWD